MTRTMLAGLFGCLLLAGCQSEFALHSALPDQPDELVPWEPGPATVPPGPDFPDPPDMPDAPDLPDTPGGPWGDIDPGNLPEIYFAVAWTEYDCSYDDVDGDGSIGDEEPPDPDDDIDGDGLDDEDWYGGCPARYAVVDLMGQVIAEFPLPLEQQDWTPYLHLGIEPAGPGQFLVIAENWMDEYGDDGDGDGFWTSAFWQAWLADAYTGELTELMHWDYVESMAEVTATGRLLDLGGYYSWAHLGMFANDPEWLVVWSGGTGCQPLENLRQIHLPGDHLDRFWEPEDLLPPELMDGSDIVQLWPWTMQTGLDEQGRANMLLGVSDTYCADETAPTWDMVAWSPTDGPLWSAEAATYSWMQTAQWAGHGGGAMLELEPSWGAATWHVHRPDGALSGPLPDDLYNVKAGPMLDPEGPTFMALGSTISDLGQWKGVLDVHHEGEVVWRIDSLRFGLQDRNVFFQDVVMLPMLPEAAE